MAACYCRNVLDYYAKQTVSAVRNTRTRVGRLYSMRNRKLPKYDCQNKGPRPGPFFFLVERISPRVPTCRASLVSIPPLRSTSRRPCGVSCVQCADCVDYVRLTADARPCFVQETLRYLEGLPPGELSSNLSHVTARVLTKKQVQITVSMECMQAKVPLPEV